MYRSLQYPFESASHLSNGYCSVCLPPLTLFDPRDEMLYTKSSPSLSVELTHLVVKWSAVRNQSEIETSLKMRGMSPFLFVKLVQQRRTQNHAKPAHRVRRSSGQLFTGTTRSAGVGRFGLGLAILVGLAKKWCCATVRPASSSRPSTIAAAVAQGYNEIP